MVDRKFFSFDVMLKSAVKTKNGYIIELVLGKMLKDSNYVDRPHLGTFYPQERDLIIKTAIERENNLIMKFLIDDGYTTIKNVMDFIFQKQYVPEMMWLIRSFPMMLNIKRYQKIKQYQKDL